MEDNTDNSAQDAALRQLSSVLQSLESNPDDVTLLKRQITLMQELQMSSEVLDATMRLASLIMLGEDQWLAHFDLLLSTSPTPLSLDSFVVILERFEQAEQDYLSLAILLRHVEFILGCSKSAAGLAATQEQALDVDDDVRAFLEPDAVRAMLRSAVVKGNGLLSESHLLWQPWIDWELANFKDSSQSQHIHQLFAERMATPHSNMDVTSAAYSSFCSEHCPDEYEQRLVEITSIAQPAKHKWSGEKRFGKTREELELRIAADPSAFTAYIEWETDFHAKDPKNDKAPSTDVGLTCAIFERAIAFYARAASAAEASLLQMPRQSKKSKGKEKQDVADARLAGEQTLAAYKRAESMTWERYARWTEDSAIRSRAVRACPSSGSAWRHYLNQLESSGTANDQLAEVFGLALRLGLLVTPDDISDIYVCRAASLHRCASNDVPHPILQLAVQGFNAIAKVSRTGDPSLRLEKFLLDWGENYGGEYLEDIFKLLDKPFKSRSSSYQMVTLRAGVEARQGLKAKARETFNNALQRNDLDWPEAVHDAFLQFETLHGDLSDLAAASAQVETELAKLSKRRERAAEAQTFISNVATEDAVLPEVPEPVQVDEATASVAVNVKADAPVDDGHFKRDREHTTILVTGLPGNIDKATVEAYFVEIGHVRETTLLEQKDGQAALVEFRFADAVPIALERDGKKIGSSIVRVSMLWRSTLFVTNFPKDMDDAGLRQMFGQYGTILQTRWPSRKYADSRRFCYITMSSPSNAQEALVLNGLKLDDFPLTVLISDPSAKTKRSDADDSTNRTLFVGGLTAKTTEQDVQDLFRQHGVVKHVKLGWDPVKRICRGFAFVEMETEESARSCLTLDGSHRQGKGLKVQMSDPNHVNKKPDVISAAGARNAAEKRLRTVRLHNLPEGTQEGLLQQELEKIVPVKRVEIFARSQEAIAELTNQADVGVVLLRTEPFVLNGVTIAITEQDKRQVSKKDDKAPTSALPFAPRAARRGGKAIGKPRAAPTAQPQPQGQNAFRALVESRNAELAESAKRKAEEDGSNTESKRQKAE